MTTEEGIKLIDKFMDTNDIHISIDFVYGRGEVYVSGNEVNTEEDGVIEANCEAAQNGFALEATAKTYANSWERLMPVVGKISKECEEPEELDGLKYALLCDDINTAYEFVVDYIQSMPKA